MLVNTLELMKMGGQVRTCSYRKTTDKDLLLHYRKAMWTIVINDPSHCYVESCTSTLVFT